MSDEIFVAAPAKVNLGLRVLEKRSDGFHGIFSIFQTVGLCDKLFVRPLFEKNVCRIVCDGMALPGRNTLTLAYDACREILGEDIVGVEVRLEKHIPSGGGLGGGSSDAASLLLALKKCGVRISRKAALEVAAKVGSDVFFFLYSAEKSECAALVQGRGECVSVISPRSDLHWVLIFPDVHSSTAQAYAWLDEFRKKSEAIREKKVIFPCADDWEKVYRGPVKDWNFVNDFTSVVAANYQKVRLAIEDIRKTGALFCDMSGSGSTVFGVYEDARHSSDAANRLSSRWKTVSL